MANEEHLAILKQGVEAWNEWRRKSPHVRLDLAAAKLARADLADADLTGANFTNANLAGARLIRAHLNDADLTRADLTGADLTGACLAEAKLTRADLAGAKLTDAKLAGADLTGANLISTDLAGKNLAGAKLAGAILRDVDLRQATLIDARLDGADLTGAKLWETQRTGWSIKGVVCRRAFWDREGEKADEYGEGEFERAFAEKPRIVLHYPGGMSPVDLAMLPLIVAREQAKHPDCALHIRSVQDEGSGAVVTITVEDLAGREDGVFRQEVAQVEAKLECVVEERDFLRQLLWPMFSKMAEVMALPRQTVHVSHPAGSTPIEGPAMSRDTYNIPGQAGAVGPGAHAHDNTFQQLQGGLDLPRLAEELARLRGALRQQPEGPPERDEAVGAVAAAEKAARQDDGPAALRHLKAAGGWALGVAEKIGVPLAVEALKRAMMG